VNAGLYRPVNRAGQRRNARPQGRERCLGKRTDTLIRKRPLARQRCGSEHLKPLPEPVDLEQYRVRRQTRLGGVINEYHLVAWRG
jgi:hypothetical protein